MGLTQSAAVSQYPWFAKVGDCGGSLVSPEFVLTAAHCKDHFSEVSIGATCYDSAHCDGTREKFIAVNKYVHPEYNQSKKSNDLLLIQLNGISSVSYVAMDDGSYSTNYAGGKKLSGAGFGSVSSNQYPMDNIAYDRDLEYVDLMNCSSSAGTVFDDSVLCTTCPSEGSCWFGSAGGGPIYDEENDVLVGVMSALKDCTGLSINSRISNELTWIKETICKNQVLTSDIPAFCFTSKTTSQISRQGGSPTNLSMLSVTRSLSSCASGEKLVVIQVATDKFAAETSWQLVISSNSTLVYSSSTYEDYTTYTESFCLSECHEFTITDSFGDGISTPGALTVTVDGVVLESSFTGVELKRTVGCAACTIDEVFVGLDFITDEYVGIIGSVSGIEWSIKSVNSGETLEKGNNYAINSTYAMEFCLPYDSCMDFSIKRAYTYPYYLTVDGSEVASGNKIWDVPETTIFACPPTVSPAPSMSPSAHPSRTPWCGSDETSVYITLNTDDSSATTWQLKNLESDLIIQEGSGYTASSSFNIPLCVQESICHSFSIFRNWGFPYKLEVDHVLIASGDKIWDKGETTEFGCAPTISPAPSSKPSQIPTRTPCGGNEMDVLVILNTDGSGDKTTWQVSHNGNNQTIESGSGYADNTPYEIGMCLSNVIEYTFTIFNNWSNLYYLKVDGVVVASGNNIWGATSGEATVFGSFAPTVSPIPTSAPISNPPSAVPSVEPSYGNSCASDEDFVLLELATDTYVATMKWEVTNMATSIVVETGTGYAPSSSYTIVLCLPQECHTFSIYNYWTNPYYLKVNNVLVASGSEIWDTPETTEFGCLPTSSPTLSPNTTPVVTSVPTSHPVSTPLTSAPTNAILSPSVPTEVLPSPVVLPEGTPVPTIIPQITPFLNHEFQIISTYQSNKEWCWVNSKSVKVKNCDDSDEQKWRVDKYGHIISLSDGRCILRKGSLGFLKMGGCANNVKRLFVYSSFENTIRWKKKSPKVATISGDVPSYAQRLMLVKRDDGFNTQQWLLRSTDGSFQTSQVKNTQFQIRSAYSSNAAMCIVPSESVEGAKIEIQQCVASDNQHYWTSDEYGRIQSVGDNRFCIYKYKQNGIGKLKLSLCGKGFAYYFAHNVFDNTIGQSRFPDKLFTVNGDQALSGTRVIIEDRNVSLSSQQWNLLYS